MFYCLSVTIRGTTFLTVSILTSAFSAIRVISVTPWLTISKILRNVKNRTVFKSMSFIIVGTCNELIVNEFFSLDDPIFEVYSFEMFSLEKFF